VNGAFVATAMLCAQRAKKELESPHGACHHQYLPPDYETKAKVDPQQA